MPNWPNFATAVFTTVAAAATVNFTTVPLLL